MPAKTTRSSVRRRQYAAHLPSETQSNLLRRLKRAEGQMRGVQRMLEEQRYCPDVLIQISAIHESLRAVERILLQNHLRFCATNALRSGDEARAQTTYEELTELFYRHAR
jgi:DNA-binding FrmR family transcriptional regulator